MNYFIIFALFTFAIANITYNDCTNQGINYGYYNFICQNCSLITEQESCNSYQCTWKNENCQGRRLADNDYDFSPTVCTSIKPNLAYNQGRCIDCSILSTQQQCNQYIPSCVYLQNKCIGRPIAQITSQECYIILDQKKEYVMIALFMKMQVNVRQRNNVNILIINVLVSDFGIQIQVIQIALCLDQNMDIVKAPKNVQTANLIQINLYAIVSNIACRRMSDLPKDYLSCTQLGLQFGFGNTCVDCNNQLNHSDTNNCVKIDDYNFRGVRYQDTYFQSSTTCQGVNLLYFNNECYFGCMLATVEQCESLPLCFLQEGQCHVKQNPKANATYQQCEALGIQYGFQSQQGECIECTLDNCKQYNYVCINEKNICRGFRKDDVETNFQCHSLGKSFVYNSHTQNCIDCSQFLRRNDCLNENYCKWETTCIAKQFLDSISHTECQNFGPTYGWSDDKKCTDCSTKQSQKSCITLSECMWKNGQCFGKTTKEYQNISDCSQLGQTFVQNSNGFCIDCNLLNEQNCVGKCFWPTNILGCQPRMDCNTQCQGHSGKKCLNAIDKFNNKVISCVYKQKACSEKDCHDLTQEECQANKVNNKVCIYSSEKSQCKLYGCDDITSKSLCDQHTTQPLNGFYCQYDAKLMLCSFIYQDNCSNFINELACLHYWDNKQTIRAVKCSWNPSLQTCKDKYCDEITSEDECALYTSQKFNGSFCYWNVNGHCQVLSDSQFNSCAVFKSEYQCQSNNFKGMQCMWSNYIDHTEHVASRCDFFACIHISDLSMCEKYNSNNLVCKNVNGECKQATCSDISSDHCNLYVSITNQLNGTHCFWSNSENQCLEMTSKYGCQMIELQSVCNQHMPQIFGNCKWDSVSSKCYNVQSCEDLQNQDSCHKNTKIQGEYCDFRNGKCVNIKHQECSEIIDPYMCVNAKFKNCQYNNNEMKCHELKCSDMESSDCSCFGQQYGCHQSKSECLSLSQWKVLLLAFSLMILFI